ncbi:MAG: proline dehydrogenase [Dactylosporangium sp.]|nr:proline dehydrogenase family protein [Dactylosporangium sp.]NNJ61717.1 proline dehydrogenase [Dactylosporangium sp.]
MLRSVILAAARSHRAERLIETVPLTRGMARQFIAGEDVQTALATTTGVVEGGLAATLDLLRADAGTLVDAEEARADYERLLVALTRSELTPSAEISVRLSVLGFGLGWEVAFEHTHAICARASEAGTTVTLEAEHAAATDAVLDILDRLWTDFPTTGVVLPAALRRTEADCRELAAAGARVRLCKKATAEPESVAYQTRHDIDRSFVRCLNVLLSGGAYPLIATHDARLIAIAEDRAKWFNRTRDQFEFQLAHGIRPAEQHRLAAVGYTVRVYLPFGEHWYAYLMSRFADRPSKAGLLYQALRSRA